MYFTSRSLRSHFCVGMKDPRKLCNQIAGTTSRVCFGERFIVTMTLALNGNENAWEYPAFSMLPDCTATQSDLQLLSTSCDYDQISIADKAMINTDNSNFLQFLIYRESSIDQYSHLSCYRASANSILLIVTKMLPSFINFNN